MTTVSSRAYGRPSPPARARAIAGSSVRSSASEPNAPWPWAKRWPRPARSSFIASDRLVVAGERRDDRALALGELLQQLGNSRGHAPAQVVRGAPGVGDAGRLAHVAHALVDSRRATRRSALRSGARARDPCGRPRAAARASRVGDPVDLRRASYTASCARRSRRAAACRRCRRGGGCAQPRRRPSSRERRARFQPPRERRDQPRAGLDVGELRRARRASACSAAGSRRRRWATPARRDVDRRRRRCRCRAAEASTVNGIPSASAVSWSSSNTRGLIVAPRVDDRPAAELVLAQLLRVDARERRSRG